MAYKHVKEIKEYNYLERSKLVFFKKNKKLSVFKCSDAFKYFPHKCTFSQLYGPLTVEYNE